MKKGRKLKKKYKQIGMNISPKISQNSIIFLIIFNTEIREERKMDGNQIG